MENLFSLTVIGYIMLIAGIVLLLCTIIWIIAGSKRPEKSNRTKYDVSSLLAPAQIYSDSEQATSKPVIKPDYLHNNHTADSPANQNNYTMQITQENKTQLIDNDPFQTVHINKTQSPPATPKLCKSCGNPLQPNAKYCPKCGEPVAES